jgi:SAM-dependent methyltransferase
MKPLSQPPPPPDSNPKTYETVHKLLGLLKAGARILDAPCGSGRLTWVLLRGGYQVVPGDINVAKYKLAEPPITFVDLNGPIPFPDQHFDAAVFCEGPQVLENPAQALRELARVLKPGSILIVAMPNVANLFSRFRFLLTSFFNKFPRPFDERLGEGNFNPVTLYELRYLLHHHGFTIDRICTNRYKLSHLLPLPLAPLVWAATGLTVFLKCRKTGLQHMRYEIWRQMTSFPMLFGETVVLRAFKEKPSSIRI